MKINVNWEQLKDIPSRNYKCGYCGNPLATNKGYAGKNKTSNKYVYIYTCHFCNNPTFFDFNGKQTPGATIGNPIKHIENEDIEKLFLESNSCYTIGAYTSAVMCCRKLLMNISVEQGGEEGKSFVYYVNYLNDNNFIPPNGKDWVDSIRRLGNEANHKISFKTEDDAKLIITFTEMLLRFIYEMPGIMKESMEIEVIETPIEPK